MSVLQESGGVPCKSGRTIAGLPAGDCDGSPGSPIGFETPPGVRLADLVKAAVLQTLDRFEGNRTQAAQSLGISVRTLQRKLKRLARRAPSAGEEAEQVEAAMRQGATGAPFWQAGDQAGWGPIRKVGSNEETSVGFSFGTDW